MPYPTYARLLCLGLLASTLSTAARAGVTYDAGTPQRPIEFSDVMVMGVTYNATVTYNNDGSVNPLPVGDLPDSLIPAARAALLSELNNTGVDSFRTNLLFQLNTATLPLSPGLIQFDGQLQDNLLSANNWIETTGLLVQSGSGFMLPQTGFVQFTTAVPEPASGVALFSLVAMTAGCRRSRSRNTRSAYLPN